MSPATRLSPVLLDYLLSPQSPLKAAAAQLWVSLGETVLRAARPAFGPHLL